jgi:predicted PurR-regulated permease PerM
MSVLATGFAPALLAPETAVALQAADTVVTVVARDGLTTAAQVSVVILGVVAVGALLTTLILWSQLRKVNRTVRALGDRALDRSSPLLDRGKDVADNVEFITRAVRGDVERLNASVKALSERLHQASDRMESRIEEFNALMEVVQAEAEGLFVDTASAVRGVRAGARSLTEGEAKREVEPRPESDSLPPSRDPVRPAEPDRDRSLATTPDSQEAK